ncbi:NADP-dependent oxidoreductase [Paenibacillus psychroresistens]|uniref:NADP-dependent oxidoreductase n=1 Tax=Paenibacillus psychroresistens TaxID=1778678 RepID=A0A6B8RFU9_9BACL|nr:NADP-dependent oxidoreductase [Paenibacillus psychroresistens]QGQ94604.1 NADP-dependent oxidoreductase [Paenibacillus psychroresistens]
MTDKSIQAIRFHQYGGPEELRYETIPCLEPAEGEVLIRVHAAGVLPIDWKIRQGLIKFPITFPSIPGTALAGVVEKVGPGVTEFQQGQAVFGRSSKGTYTEYTTAVVSSLALIPRAVSFNEAATISGGATTAWQALINESNIKAGDRVLIHGAAGGVGQYAVQFAKWKGAFVFGTCGSANVDFVQSLGVDQVIDYTTTAFEDVAVELDIVLDTIGGATLEKSWSLVKQGGILISLVMPPSQEKANASGIKAIKPTALASSKDLEQIVQLIAENKVKATIAATYSLQDAGQAHALSQLGHGRGRIVLQIVD